MGRKLGQILLIDSNIIEKIVKAANLSKNDVVVEVGCGDGILTKALAKKVKKLYVIEIDKKCVENTKNNIGKLDNVHYILGNILETGFLNISETSFKIVANIPYYITAKFLKLIIANRPKVEAATIMIQKEFADKLIAMPSTKQYTSLTLYCRYFLDAKYLFKVSKNSFFPVPKIDSAILTFTPKTKPPFELEDEDLFFNIIRSAFNARRKCLTNALSKNPYLKLNPDFKKIHFFEENPKIRGETMALLDYHKLYEELKQYII